MQSQTPWTVSDTLIRRASTRKRIRTEFEFRQAADVALLGYVEWFRGAAQA